MTLLPPESLEDLAGTVGNSAMAELLAAETPEPELSAFTPGDIAPTEPFEAAAEPPALTGPPDLTASPGPLYAASPGAFTEG